MTDIVPDLHPGRLCLPKMSSMLVRSCSGH
jgi:hypothetical protein